MNKVEKKCGLCRWFEKENNQYICGYVAEVYHIAKLVDVDFICIMHFAFTKRS